MCDIWENLLEYSVSLQDTSVESFAEGHRGHGALLNPAIAAMAPGVPDDLTDRGRDGAATRYRLVVGPPDLTRRDTTLYVAPVTYARTAEVEDDDGVLHVHVIVGLDTSGWSIETLGPEPTNGFPVSLAAMVTNEPCDEDSAKWLSTVIGSVKRPDDEWLRAAETLIQGQSRAFPFPSEKPELPFCFWPLNCKKT